MPANTCKIPPRHNTTNVNIQNPSSTAAVSGRAPGGQSRPPAQAQAPLGCEVEVTSSMDSPPPPDTSGAPGLPDCSPPSGRTGLGKHLESVSGAGASTSGLGAAGDLGDIIGGGPKSFGPGGDAEQRSCSWSMCRFHNLPSSVLTIQFAGPSTADTVPGTHLLLRK